MWIYSCFGGHILQLWGSLLHFLHLNISKGSMIPLILNFMLIIFPPPSKYLINSSCLTDSVMCFIGGISHVYILEGRGGFVQIFHGIFCCIWNGSFCWIIISFILIEITLFQFGVDVTYIPCWGNCFNFLGRFMIPVSTNFPY